jgi:hypothetical protein
LKETIIYKESSCDHVPAVKSAEVKVDIGRTGGNKSQVDGCRSFEDVKTNNNYKKICFLKVMVN